MQLLDCNIAYISTRDIDLNLNKLDFTLGSDRVPITIPKKIRDEIKLGLMESGILPTSMIFWHAISTQDSRPIMFTAFL